MMLTENEKKSKNKDDGNYSIDYNKTPMPFELFAQMILVVFEKKQMSKRHLEEAYEIYLKGFDNLLSDEEWEKVYGRK